MTEKDQIIEQLNNLLKKEKFAYSEWDKRGLNPSGPQLCQKMESNLNSCIISLIDQVNMGSSQRHLKSTLLNGLKCFRSIDYDTEEREFICTYFDRLSQFLNVRINNQLNAFLYGFLLAIVIRINRVLKGQEKVVDKREQNCTRCNSKLQTLIFKKDDSIPDNTFFIVRCNICNEFNLIDPGPGIKELRFNNYEIVEKLQKTEFNPDQANIRLEQIKFFRK